MVKNALPFWQGVFLCLLFGFSLTAAGACSSRGDLQWSELGKVVDGDTLKLADGRVLRLVGVNTPELGREGRPDQALARQARRAVEEFFAADSRVGLSSGPQPRDRYGRILASVYGSDNRSLAAALLAQGLAWQVAIPPNLGDTDCLQRVEDRARGAGLGVWSEPEYRIQPAADLSPLTGGFALVTGEIVSVVETRAGWWLELPGLSLRLPREHWHYFAAAGLGTNPESWRGRQVEVRGWIINRRHSRAVTEGGHPPLKMVIAHPRMISLR